LFEHLAGELQEKSITGKLWDMFKELLQLMLENISIEYGPIKSYQDLTKTRIFKCIKEKFSNSLIGLVPTEYRIISFFMLQWNVAY